MSRTGNPYDNAWMESAIGKIKQEVLGRSVPPDHATAQQQLFAGIECWYNQRRRHSAPQTLAFALGVAPAGEGFCEEF